MDIGPDQTDELRRVIRPGDGVRFTPKGGTLSEYGVLDFWWVCLDEWCADVTTDDGNRAGLIPALGDRIEPAEPVKE